MWHFSGVHGCEEQISATSYTHFQDDIINYRTLKSLLNAQAKIEGSKKIEQPGGLNEKVNEFISETTLCAGFLWRLQRAFPSPKIGREERRQFFEGIPRHHPWLCAADDDDDDYYVNKTIRASDFGGWCQCTEHIFYTLFVRLYETRIEWQQIEALFSKWNSEAHDAFWMEPVASVYIRHFSFGVLSAFAPTLYFMQTHSAK